MYFWEKIRISKRGTFCRYPCSGHQRENKKRTVFPNKHQSFREVAKKNVFYFMIIIIRPDLLISLFTAGRIDLRDAKAFKKSMGYSLVWSVGLQPVEMMTTGNAEIENGTTPLMRAMVCQGKLQKPYSRNSSARKVPPQRTDFFLKTNGKELADSRYSGF